MTKKAKNSNKSKPITVTQLVNRELNRIQKYVEKQEDIGFIAGGKIGKMIRNRKTRYTRKTLEKLKKIKAKEIKEQIYFEAKDSKIGDTQLVKASELNRKKYQKEKREFQILRQIQAQELRDEKKREKIHIDYENLDDEGVIDKYMQVFDQTINHVGFSAKFREILQRYGIFVIQNYGRKTLAKAISKMYLTFTNITPKTTYEDDFVSSFIEALEECVEKEINKKDDRLKDYYEAVTKPQIELATADFFQQDAYDLDELETAYRRKRRSKNL
jgi:hypothetical protein